MSKRHLKTINTPRSWPIERKKRYWVSRPNPGPHSLRESLPLNVIFRDLLGYIKTTRELKKILNQEVVKVNGKVRKDYKFPVGIFDILELGEEEFYRILYNEKGKFYLNKIGKEERNNRIYKVINKRILKGKKSQLNLSNGENLLTDKEVKTGDSILLEDKKIKNILKLDKGSLIYLSGGKHIGVTGKVKTIEGKKLFFMQGKEELETLKKYAFVIGKDKPIIEIKK
ncbi:MAG: 30S ribosomal protein S4e [Nanoarchaeota archaeon]|nr:30S ribosomal protein S4e [Nanoarchaeota archaeon]